ncbi:MAG: bifunctional alpha/beta hydrolase/OsmC family protein [Pseudomonadales bacterium]
MARTRVDFPGHDGSTLSGLLEYPASAAKSYALFAHCFSCGKDIAAASRISRALVARGIAVLRFDFTGLGNSDGDFANTNFSSNVEDLIAAAGFLKENYIAPQLLIGHSLGGTAVLAAAGAIESSRAVVTIGAPSAPEHVVKQFGEKREEIEREGSAEVDLGGRSFNIKREFIDDARATQIDEAVKGLRKALLIMHSPLDKTVSIDEAEHLYKGAKHPKSFVSLDKADHLLTDKTDAEYAAATIAAWAGRYINSHDSFEHESTGIESGRVWVGEHNKQFARTVVADEHTWLSDEPTSVGGQELGPDPYEQLLAALGTCTSMTIRMYANRKKIVLDDINVTLKHERRHGDDCEECDEDERKLEVLAREIELTGDLSDAQRERLLEIADRCPVHRTLTGNLKIETRLSK